MRLRPLLALCLLAGAGIAQAKAIPESQLDAMLAGRSPGRPAKCISGRDMDSSLIVTHVGILFRKGATLYLNRPRTGVEVLEGDPILVNRQFDAQFCAADLVRLTNRYTGGFEGAVTLGEFVPYYASR